MPEKIRSTQPPLKFLPPKFNPFIHQLTKLAFPLLLRFRFRPWLPSGISNFETENVVELVKLYQQFQAGKVRFLMAFRHPEVDDPLSMFYLLSRAVPKAAKQHSIFLQKLTHSHFIYDRGMTVWAGDWLGWYFSKLGGMPIRRGKRIDKRALQVARQLFTNSNMPLSIAPEGATNGHSGIVSPLEPGVSQLAFWCIEDLIKENRSEEVFILPITIKYSYPKPPWRKLDWLLTKLERESGLVTISSNNLTNQNKEEIYYQRILKLAEHLVVQMEDFYQRFYHINFEPIEIDSEFEPNTEFIKRLQRLLDKALTVAEQYFSVPPQGTLIDRCRRLEDVGWSYIYREDLADLNTLAPLTKGLADWVAIEADQRMKHMRLVESFIAVSGNYITEKPTFERFAEMTLLMFDLISRLKDNTLPGRPRLGWRQSHISVGKPISVTQRWNKYSESRHSAREEVSNLTQEIYQELKNMI
ncbi:1-acyl-sn-glycerol-3-phosphate acyltransferase [Calothrix sp. PCC 6303]|uniref:1-acyl-sn-glycerol-3-phosphate acyltransferase n=1 Tax=Calothrix sp. PCC 6303 TaxID=1170562 RepID=UPI0002A009A2|nr:1-acyl-sn-glycerol-3-phosphate acyltransferase [Calothrix sp. PCC 6303]AFZ02975.1 phospholipid/glycerol acyltransferase [Calothrix sp. PCC 6303]